jgi:mRNA-degrading endonuclease toxin of MazEF toxin-antitoxin module
MEKEFGIPSEAKWTERRTFWLVEFEPNIGSEIDKLRPAIVVSTSGFTDLPLRIAVPIRGKIHDVAWFFR